MFEKEAEDAVKRIRCFDCMGYSDCLENNKYYSCNVFKEAIKNWKDGFQKGAEFGYNKANEWHKQDYSLFDFVMKYENGKFKCEYKSGKVFESVDGETWKEIVLPKESK